MGNVRCIFEHEIYHEVILMSPDGIVEAVICRKCCWLLQKDPDEWRVKQVFDSRAVAHW